MTQFLHKKANSDIWYFRRRFPKDLVKALGKQTHLQSLRTTDKREAERRARAVSVEFDKICEVAREKLRLSDASPVTDCDSQQSFHQVETPEQILQEVPYLVRQAACRVVEEQTNNPKEWRKVVGRWQSFYRAMIEGAVPEEAHLTAIKAKAILNGFETVIQGNPSPSLQTGTPIRHTTQTSRNDSAAVGHGNDWRSLCKEAVTQYKEQVTRGRWQMAEKKLSELCPNDLTVSAIQDELKAWCMKRLGEVSARTVSLQLHAMVAALKQSIPGLSAPRIAQLKGVLQPKNSDRLPIPLDALANTIKHFKKQNKRGRPSASAFDDIAIETLAVLGLRPGELLGATSKSLVQKEEIFGRTGTYFRISSAKNRASERDIPLSDGSQEVIDLKRLRQMLAHQENTGRDVNDAVSSLRSRFSKASGGYTPYQIRHTWKDIAQHCGIEFELRERIMGHDVPGMAAVYGSGIPLRNGLDSLLIIRNRIFEVREH